MERKDMLEIIRDEIKNFSVEQLKGGKKEPRKVDPEIDKAIRENELDQFIFGGVENANNHNSFKTKFLKEETEVKDELDSGIEAAAAGAEAPEVKDTQSEDPWVNQSEVDEFEKDFRDKVAPQVDFDKNEKGEIDFKLYNGDSGIEAKVSGTIPMQGENRITWSYSLQNGAHVEANSELTEMFVKTVDKLYFYYKEWVQTWTNRLTELPAE